MLHARALSRLAATTPRALLRASASARAASLLARAYATKQVEAAPRAKKAVKSPAESKTTKKAAAPTKKTATAAKKPAKKDAKKKAVKKKAVKKPAKKVTRKRPAKVLTGDEAIKARYTALRVKSLPTQPYTHNSVTARNAFLAHELKGIKDPTTSIGEVSNKFNNLTSAEREHWNQVAIEQTKERQAALKAWVEQHTPEQIRLANLARAHMRTMLKANGSSNPNAVKLTKWKNIYPIADDRSPARPATAYTLFFKERVPSSEFSGIPIPERARLIGAEWKKLPEGQRKALEERAAADKERYASETAAASTKYGKL